MLVAKILPLLKRPNYSEKFKSLLLLPFRDARKVAPLTTQSSPALDLRLRCKACLRSFSLPRSYCAASPCPSTMHKSIEIVYAEVPKHGNSDVHNKYHLSTRLFRGYKEIKYIRTICKFLSRPRF